MALNFIKFITRPVQRGGFLKAQWVQETWVRSLGWEDSLEEGMATYSNILV